MVYTIWCFDYVYDNFHGPSVVKFKTIFHSDVMRVNSLSSYCEFHNTFSSHIIIVRDNIAVFLVFHILV